VAAKLALRLLSLVALSRDVFRDGSQLWSPFVLLKEDHRLASVSHTL